MGKLPLFSLLEVGLDNHNSTGRTNERKEGRMSNSCDEEKKYSDLLGVPFPSHNLVPNSAPVISCGNHYGTSFAFLMSCRKGGLKLET